jgi:hypothetical protein
MFSEVISSAPEWLMNAAHRVPDIAVSVAALIAEHPGTFVQLGLGASVLWSLICRLNQMQAGVTRWLVIAQHATLFLAVLCHMLFPVGPVVLLGGMLAYLWLGAYRWRHAAPEGTRCPLRELTRQEAGQAAGGSRD